MSDINRLARYFRIVFMISKNFIKSHHVIAIGCNVGILPLLPIVLYFGLIFISGDIGGPLNLVLIPFVNFFVSVIVTVFIVYPLAIYLEKKKIQVKVFKSGSLLPLVSYLILLILVLVIYLLIVITGMINLGYLDIFYEEEYKTLINWMLVFTFYGGIPSLLGGMNFWFLQKTITRLLSKRNSEKSIEKTVNAS